MHDCFPTRASTRWLVGVPQSRHGPADAREPVRSALARYYDWEHADYDIDVPLYLDFARRTGGPILELACGSGRLMGPLLELGEEVVGLDSSGADA